MDRQEDGKVRLTHPRFCLVAVGLFLSLISLAPVADAAGQSPSPVLLVHGIAWELEEEDATWGRVWYMADGTTKLSGMIGFLDAKGLDYGGVIRPKGAKASLPERLDTAGVEGDPRKAKLFVLKFSKSANTDGVGYKALEVAESVRQLCLFTGSEKVRIVAHSAGGLMARAYLQSALPGVEFRGDVDRMITVGTPHLGSEIAEKLGDLLGTRATSIKPSAALIKNLNSKFDLPSDVTFASIVVRGIAADARGKGEELDHLVDKVFLAGLPVEYRLGGDQVVHVRSQNLRLAECAARYEKKTGKPVQYILARVPDPTPMSCCFTELTDVRVHVTSPSNLMVQHLVLGLLKENAVLWKKSDLEKLAGWCDWQARLHANGIIEAEALGSHPLSQVNNVEIEEFKLTKTNGDRRYYAFSGKAWSKNMAIPLRKRWTHVSGTVGLTFDAFGRVLLAESVIH